MSSRRIWMGVVVATLGIGLMAAHVARGKAAVPVPQSPSEGRTRMVLSKALPKLDGEHLRATLVEVRYGPGEVSSPHRHPCAVMAYVVQGAVRIQVESGAETIYQAGESFYERPNDFHLVSANASSTEPAKFVAYFICDRDTPLSTDQSQGNGPKGASR